MPFDHQVHRDNDYGYPHQGQEHLDGLGFPDICRPAFHEGQEQDPEVQAGRKHRDGEDDFGGRIVIEGDAGVAGAESAGAARRHGVGRGVEPLHAGELQGEKADDGQSYVSQEHPVGNAAVPLVSERFPGHAGDLRLGEGGFVLTGGDHGKEGDNADSSHPCSGDAPELQSPREPFYVVQYGRARSGET